jgi:dTDP-L-rhamnose 4-epimerase
MEIRKDIRMVTVSAGSAHHRIYEEHDVVIHLGARVGVGQSMYEISHYARQNTSDTAEMLQQLSRRPPKRLVVASSMSIYGEGARVIYEDGGTTPIPTPETRPPDLRSIYALTKYDQEQLCLIWGRAYNVPTVALRFFNTYGPGQSLSNPYTGVMAIFASRLLNSKPPIIYEDGEQSRDFIHVDDVANAVVHAALNDLPSGPYNVGTGAPRTIKDVAVTMAEFLGKDIQPVITGKQREGDIRHCFADVSKIRSTGWKHQVGFINGLDEYCQWLLAQPKPVDKVEQAHSELEAHGLVK